MKRAFTDLRPLGGALAALVFLAAGAAAKEIIAEASALVSAPAGAGTLDFHFTAPSPAGDFADEQSLRAAVAETLSQTAPNVVAQSVKRTLDEPIGGAIGVFFDVSHVFIEGRLAGPAADLRAAQAALKERFPQATFTERLAPAGGAADAAAIRAALALADARAAAAAAAGGLRLTDRVSIEVREPAPARTLDYTQLSTSTFVVTPASADGTSAAIVNTEVTVTVRYAAEPLIIRPE